MDDELNDRLEKELTSQEQAEYVLGDETIEEIKERRKEE